MKRKHKRLTFVIVALALLGAAVGLVLFAFTDNIVFFHSPTEVNEDAFRTDRRFRLGGLVEEGSVVKEQGTVKVSFRITDLAESVPVTYVGILPDLFREGQGVVAEGRLENGIFVAEEVLAKHDENYMPPEVAESLKASGKWDEMSETMKKQGHVTKGATQ
ncbi:MAG: cytochrome c maturation protein CcmE [Rhodobacterales bacterium]|nr:cytochrome c maturation protein CcmE [Rhodobacterales bacterium]